jgi:hypothetical protein
MAIEPGRTAVSGPAGVCNAGMAVKDLGQVDVRGIDELAELGDLANLLEGNDLVLLVAVDAETGRVVTAVFEAGQAIDERVENVLAVAFDQVVDVTQDSTVCCVSRAALAGRGDGATHHIAEDRLHTGSGRMLEAGAEN